MSYLEELLPEFRKGAKIRKNYWNNDAYIYYKNSIIYDNKNEPTYKFTDDSIISDDWELYQEPIDWDYIIKNKCLCWFWNDEEITRKIMKLTRYEKEKTYPFTAISESGVLYSYSNCRPVRKDEVTFYEDKE